MQSFLRHPDRKSTRLNSSHRCIHSFPTRRSSDLYQHLHFGWCPRGGSHAYYTVSYNGLLRPCNHSSAILGDLRTEGFAEIVARESTRAYWSPIPAECRQCPESLRDSCRGGWPVWPT